MTDRNSLASNAVIKVIGVGGGGGNALNTMIESGLSGVEFIAANTDLQALQANLATIKIQLGRELTKGLGAGANPEMGCKAALEDKAIIQEVLSGADMVFVTGGMGGGTGTGAAPIIAQVARELGALTVGVVTKPFLFEGKRRKFQSDIGIQSLRQSVDTLITIPNQRLLNITTTEMSLLDGFKLADEVLLNAVKGISDIINIPGRVNVDFADVKTIMSEMGMALMGIGTASGPSRAAEAARAAINSPLLEDIDIEGATGVLINITGTSSMTLHEVDEAATSIQAAAHEDANIIFGAVIDPSMGDFIRVTVIATGFDYAHVAFPEASGHNFKNPSFPLSQNPQNPSQTPTYANSTRTSAPSYPHSHPHSHTPTSPYDTRSQPSHNPYMNTPQPFHRPLHTQNPPQIHNQNHSAYNLHTPHRPSQSPPPEPEKPPVRPTLGSTLSGSTLSGSGLGGSSSNTLGSSLKTNHEAQNPFTHQQTPTTWNTPQKDKPEPVYVPKQNLEFEELTRWTFDLAKSSEESKTSSESGPALDSATESALKLAKELSHIEMGDGDFENTPLPLPKHKPTKEDQVL
jgi:cell division protein FtsZ